MLEKQYARAIQESLAGGADPNALVAGLLRSLKARGHMRLLRRIVRQLEVQMQKADVRGEKIVRLARAEDEKMFKKEIATHLGNTDAYRLTVDDSIVGGYVIEDGDTFIDGSYKTGLLQMYKSFIS